MHGVKVFIEKPYYPVATVNIRVVRCSTRGVARGVRCITGEFGVSRGSSVYHGEFGVARRNSVKHGIVRWNAYYFDISLTTVMPQAPILFLHKKCVTKRLYVYKNDNSDTIK